ADLDVVRVAEGERMEEGCRCGHPDDGEIRGRIGPDDVCLVLRPVREPDADRVRARDDVVVRDDVAAVVVDEAGALAALTLAAAAAEAGGGRAADGDVDDAAVGALIDLAHR